MEDVHNLFILKKPNDYRPERLRALHQIDAELNLIRRELIAKRLLRHTEEYQYLKDHNYGGRNGKCANDVVMKKYLTLQIWHLQRHNGALTDCDAKSCYDRIIPILLYLAYSKAGLPHSTCLWLCQCLINMEYHIVTAYGASSDTSTSTDTHPLYGIGQGATDAPSGWLLVSTILSRYYDSKAIGCTLVDPTGYLSLRWTHVMFVDDTYLIHSTGDPTAPLSTIEQVVQHDSSTWNTGLHITGGKLEGSKSKYLVLIWSFLPNGIPTLETHDNSNNPVQLHLYNRPQEQLKRIHHDINEDLFKSLGTYISGSLSDKYEYQIAQTKVQTFKKFLLSCPLTCRETRIAYNQYLIPSVLYGAIVQSFDITSCEKLHRSLLPTLLPKLRFPSTFPRPLVFGPIESGGIGLHDFNAYLLSTKIQYIIKHIRAATEIGNLLLITLQWAQLQSGIGQPLLQWTDPIPYLESSWLRHIRDGLWQISGSIYIPTLWVEPLQHKNDVYIMEVLLQDQSLTQTQLHSLNCCRLYLQVTRLSDIVTTDGKSIQTCFLHGSHHNIYTSLQWPVQRSPHTQTWKLWRQTLSRHFLAGTKLTKPLGHWVCITNKYHWFHSPKHNKVVKKITDQWYASDTTITRRHLKWNYTLEPVLYDKQCIPITDVHYHGHNCYSSSLPDVNFYMMTSIPTSSNHAANRTQPHAIQVQPNTIPSSISTTRAHLQLCDNLRIICHGSIHDQFGYYGWVVATDSHILALHHDFTTGNNEEMDSHRAILAAIHTSLLWVVEMLDSVSLQKHTSLHIQTTNRRVLNNLTTLTKYSTWFPNQMLQPHMDLMLAIVSHITSLNVIPNFQYVNLPTSMVAHSSTLKWQTHLETLALRMTTKALDSIKSDTPFQPYTTTPYGRAYLMINNALVTKQFHRAITRAWCTSDLRTYITNKFNWRPDICDDLDWCSFGSALTTQTVSFRTWTIKYVHDWLPLNMAKHIHSDNVMCPICNNTQETPYHFLFCQHYEPTLDTLRITLDHIGKCHNIDPWLTFLLYQGLSTQGPLTLDHLYQHSSLFTATEYETLLQRQSDIGWHRLHHGRFSLEWDRYQRKYLYTHGFDHPSTEPKWIRIMINAIFTHHHKRWLFRNNIAHPKNTVDTTERHQLMARIRALYDHAPYLLTSDQHCFSIPINDWETRTSYDMRRWLTIHTPHIRECRRQAQIQNNLHIRDIRTYFAPAPCTHTNATDDSTESPLPPQPYTATRTPLVVQQQTIKKYFQPATPLEVPTDPVVPHPLISPTPTQPTANTTTVSEHFSPSSYRRYTLQTSLRKYLA